MNIYLIGFMGSGKSSLAKSLAERLHSSFIDLDIEIEKRTGSPINSLFIKKGEPEFRLIEEKILNEISTNTNYVMATGGGTPCFYNNLELMNATGKTVYLETNAEILLERLTKNNQERPLLGNLKGEELKTKITTLLNQREGLYRNVRRTARLSRASLSGR